MCGPALVECSQYRMQGGLVKPFFLQADHLRVASQFAHGSQHVRGRRDIRKLPTMRISNFIAVLQTLLCFLSWRWFFGDILKLLMSKIRLATVTQNKLPGRITQAQGQ